jgi:hypothetical protein
VRKTRPEIELYMYSSNQEFPANKGHSTFLESKVERVENARYKNIVYDTEWAHDWSNFMPDIPWEQWCQVEGLGHTLGDPMKNIIIREEEFGGIIFDRINDRIYKVNIPGYKLFQEILESHKNNTMAEFRSKQFEPQDTEHFVSFLKGAGLC